MEKPQARFDILQGTLEAERLIDRLRAAILLLPPVQQAGDDDNDCPEAMVDPEYDCPEPYIPPENPFFIFNKLVATIERIEPEIAKLRQTRSTIYKATVSTSSP